ncbi:MAG: MerR family transcriptional regulator [Candidatus Cloacimonas sp.]|jgi:DNA-binding transcriptional MerR regulator|nr:MerR family transcriptional regulator [Candidatus Cloacimonadota bacterium]
MKKYYYTMGEVCNLLDLKPHIIRYWETEFRQLKPKRNKGANRQYSEQQIELLKVIKDMLYIQNYTIKGVKKRLNQMQSNEKYKKPLKILAMNEEMRSYIITEISETKAMLDQLFPSDKTEDEKNDIETTEEETES